MGVPGNYREYRGFVVSLLYKAKSGCEKWKGIKMERQAGVRS